MNDCSSGQTYIDAIGRSVSFEVNVKIANGILVVSEKLITPVVYGVRHHNVCDFRIEQSIIAESRESRRQVDGCQILDIGESV